MRQEGKTHTAERVLEEFFETNRSTIYWTDIIGIRLSAISLWLMRDGHPPGARVACLPPCVGGHSAPSYLGAQLGSPRSVKEQQH